MLCSFSTLCLMAPCDHLLYSRFGNYKIVLSTPAAISFKAHLDLSCKSFLGTRESRVSTGVLTRFYETTVVRGGTAVSVCFSTPSYFSRCGTIRRKDCTYKPLVL